MKPETKLLLKFCIVLLLAFAGFGIYHHLRTNALKQEVIDAQLKSNNELVGRFEASVEEHTGNLKVIAEKTLSLQKGRESHEQTIANTTDLDSLVRLYFRYRADLGR